jgi:hypothetical protein
MQQPEGAGLNWCEEMLHKPPASDDVEIPHKPQHDNNDEHRRSSENRRVFFRALHPAHDFGKHNSVQVDAIHDLRTSLHTG